MVQKKYPARRVVAVDVDGTLLVAGLVNAKLVEWCRRRKSEGFELILWSARGRAYAEAAARLAGLEDVFDSIIGKPGCIVDDKGWGWIRYTRVITRLD